MSTSINIKKQIAAYEEGSQISNDLSAIDVTGNGASASMIGSKMVINVPGGAGNITYYLNQTVTQSPYKEFSSVPTSAVEQTISASVAGNATTTIESFQTASGVPGTTNIPGGLWSFYLHFSGTTGDTWEVFAEVYKRNLGGTETLLLTTDAIITTSLSAVPTMILTDGVFPTSSVLTTDRIVVKVRVHNLDSNSNSITFHTEGSTNYSVATTTLNQTITGGAVTSVTGSAPITSSGGTTPNIAIPQATALADGYLDSADFATFSAKQDPISLTTTGTTGAATFIANILNVPQYQGSLTLTTTGSSGSSTLIGNTLNIPTYTLTGLGGVSSTRSLTINGTAFDLSADRTWNVGTVTSIGLSAGTGISLAGTNPITSSGTITVTNSAPDQVVSLTPSTGINVTGAYPNFTIANTAPDQTVALTAGTGIGVTGTYPNFTISNTDPTTGVTLTSSGGANSLVNDGTGPSLAVKGLTAGSGILIGSTATTVSITNSNPDQTVVLNSGTGINVTGTYPNFTLTNTSPSSGGTVTSVAALTLGTTGTDLSSTVANGTTTPVITLNVPTASATNRGALSSADWTAFNDKANTASPAFTGTPTAPTATAGTNTTQVATTAFVQNAISKQPEVIQAAASDETTNLTIGTAKVTFRMPYAMTLTSVRASLSTAQAAGAIFTVDINQNGVSVLGTKLTIDNTEKTSTTAATPATIVTSALTDDSEITIDIDQVGTALAKGLKITLIGTRA